MKKRLISLMLVMAFALTSAFGLAGCSKSSDTDSSAETKSAAVTEKDEADSDGNYKEIDSQAVLIPTSAIMLTLLENDMTYDASDDEFVWTAVQYAISNYGTADDRSSLVIDDEYSIQASKDMVKDYVRTLFADVDSIPDIPSDIYFVTYDSSSKNYTFNMVDQTSLKSRITESTKNTDDTYSITVELYNGDTDKVFATGSFVLKDDSKADIDDGDYLIYRVESAEVTKGSVG